MLDHFLEVLGKEAAYTAGIPHKTLVHRIPKVVHPTVWQFGLHDHHSEGGAGHHLDLRLGTPDTGHAHSWAMRHWPAPGEARLAIQQPTHTVKYMDFQGRIESGYGKGQVTLARRDKTEVVSADNDHVRFNLYTSMGHEEYLLHRTDDNKWLLHNVTVSRAGSAKDLPSAKPQYRSKDPSKLDPEQTSTVWQAKIDGAHSTFSFGKPGQQARIFSYRPTDRDTGIIEHTHKLPNYTEHLVPRALADTVLRGELYATDSAGHALEPARVGGLLNSNVWRSRQSQQIEGKLRPVVFDVVRWHGKDVEAAPYSDKLKMLQEAKQHAPWLELPRMAHTPEEKRKLFEDIRTGKEPSTKEGLVEWSLHSGGAPAKAKFLDEKDVVVRGIFPEKGKKRSGTMAGGFEFSYTKDGPIIGRVGSGMSHALKKDMLENPSRYVGLQARILSQRHAEHYAPRAPKFYGFHPDQELPMNVKTAAISAMREELEKIALGFKVREVESANMGGACGVMLRPAELSQETRQYYNIPEGKAMLGIAPITTFSKSYIAGGDPARAEELHNLVKRHEIIHYMRSKKGLLDGVRQPGLRNVARTAREEIAAQIGSVGRVKNPALRGFLMPVAAQDVLGSMRYAYPKGIRRAMLGGRLKALLPYAERLGLVR